MEFRLNIPLTLLLLVSPVCLTSAQQQALPVQPQPNSIPSKPAALEPQAAPLQPRAVLGQPNQPPLKAHAQQDRPTGGHWWMEAVRQPLQGNALPITLNQVVFAALQNSQRVKVARIDGFIEAEKVTQQDANFDWTAFADSLFRNTNQPTGSAIEAGAGINQLIQQELGNNLGVRRTNRIGGQFQVTQDTRLLQNNSLLTDPNDQAFSQLVLRYNQPLLRDGGMLVNYGQVILAQLNTNATIDDSNAAIATILEEVSQSYWEVYRLRARYFVQKRLVDRILQLRNNLQQRKRIDARQSLLGQAESELATQTAALAATRTQLQQAELRLIRSTGDRSLSNYRELIPVSHIPPFHYEFDPATAFQVAVQNRPEVRAAFQRIKGSDLTTQIAYRQLLPRLALILETNVTGVNGNFQLGRSLVDQFSEGGPGYAVGLTYEIPFGNRAAKSRAREAELLMSRELATLEDTIDQIRLEVEDSVVGLTGVTNQYRIRDDSIKKSQQVVDALIKRRNLFPESIDQISQLYIREVLDAQQRTTTAELALIDLLFDYSVATIRMRRATGTLLSRLSTSPPIHGGNNVLLCSQLQPSVQNVAAGSGMNRQHVVAASGSNQSGNRHVRRASLQQPSPAKSNMTRIELAPAPRAAAIRRNPPSTSIGRSTNNGRVGNPNQPVFGSKVTRPSEPNRSPPRLKVIGITALPDVDE